MNPFFNQHHTEDTLLKGIDSILNSYRHLKVYSFPTYIDPLYLRKLKNGNDNFRLISENDGIYLFELSLHVEKSDQKNKKREIDKIFIAENKRYENIYTVISLGYSRRPFNQVLSNFNKAYPKISLSFITHRKLENLLVKFRDELGFDLTIIRATSHSRIGKNIMTSISWTEFSIERAFEWVASENGWFQNLTFRVDKSSMPTAEISISRNGIIRSNRYFKLVFSDFILPISKVTYENIKFFSKRARLEDPDRNVHPLVIDIGEDQFINPEENHKFIDIMKTMKATSLSVIHGNPYIHISLIDYYDGSSFDILVLSTNKIIIVPQLKASFQAIKRLINYVFDNYTEGDIKEYEVGFDE
jgi:hypothetical protein